MKKNGYESITDLLPEGWEAAARESGAFGRSRKIKTPEELLRLNLLYLTSGGSFGKTSAMLKLTEGKGLNKTAVYERVQKSAGWLQWLCLNLNRKEGFLAPAPKWLENRRVCLVDASDESKPGSRGADYRLHYLVNLFTLGLVEMHLTEANEGETITRYSSLEEQDIIIGDRAYGTLKGIAHVKAKGADYLFCLRSNAFLLYDASGEKVSLSEKLGELKENETISLDLFYKEKNSLQPVRICAIGKSRQAREEGLRQIKKSNSKKMRGKVSATQEIFNRFIVVATSLPEEISARQVMELYRIRWQIELVFKRFKSIFHYDEIPSKNHETACAWFYGKLLVAALCEALVNQGRFPPKEAQDGYDPETSEPVDGIKSHV